MQKARQSGAPIDGVVVSAGIPELEEAVDLIDELNDVGISPRVLQARHRRADPLGHPDRRRGARPAPVIVHIEGGRAGGHHSWEDLDDLLLATYSELRSQPNITICVGGGIGTPERAAEYLSGRWSQAYGYPLMPVDGILVGTAAMACLEATTSPAVKQLLVDTAGTDAVGRRRKSAERHGIRAQPARRRHPRDRQRRVALRPAARRGRR